MRIITLVDNTAGALCPGEHGLSVWVETEDYCLLSDCGASGLFLRNAEALGLDLTQVDAVVLSHGHYDHTGGVLDFAQVNPHARIYLQKAARGAFYHDSVEGKERYIGMDPEIGKLPQLVFVEGNLRLNEECFLFSGFGERDCPSWTNQELKEKVKGVLIQDEFAHEQCLAIAHKGKKILLSGCAHSGILTILQRYRDLFQGNPDLVISGFHMGKKGDFTPKERDYIVRTAQTLKETGSLFYTGHCTGQKAFALMKEILGDQLQAFCSGAEILKE